MESTGLVMNGQDINMSWEWRVAGGPGNAPAFPAFHASMQVMRCSLIHDNISSIPQGEEGGGRIHLDADLIRHPAFTCWRLKAFSSSVYHHPSARRYEC